MLAKVKGFFTKPQPEGWVTLRHERRDYGTYMIGQNIIYEFTTGYMTVYLTMCGLEDLRKIGLIMMALKIWDAFNDTMFGGIADKVKFKKQVKFLPWIRVSVALIPLSTVLLYAIPSSFSENSKLIWFSVAYILWDTFYTLCDAPIYGMVTTMTSNLTERNTIMSHSRLYSGVGAGLGVLAGTIFVSEKLGLTYTFAAVASSVLAFLTMVPICIRGKERNYTSADREQEFGVREMAKYLFSNKYLLIFFGAYLIMHCLGTANALGMLVSFYFFGSSLFNLVLTMLVYLPVAFLAILAPRLLTMVDKYKLFFYCNVAVLVMGVIIYFAGYQNKYIFIALCALRGVPLGIATFLVFMFTPDCAEYGKFKSGVDARGITFALQTFSAKLTGAVSSSLGIFVLGLFGWVSVKAESFAELAEMTANGFSQTEQALNGLWIAYALVPVIGMALGVVLLYFYKLSNSDVQLMSDCNAGKISREEAVEKLTPAIKKEFI
ncbi:MAG: MFS transporter [Oscillospiraceae bacterium]|nr:MFS transporter [Oscillospiraceae bacterium]